MAANLTARTYTKLNIADNEREIRNKEYGMQTLCRRKCSLALVKISTAMSIDSIMQRTIQLLLSIVAVYHFRSNDFTIIDLQGACCSWQEYLKMDVKGTRASMPHAGDSILIQGMRQINVAEIGSDTREHRELSELTFEAELEEQAETKAEKLQAEETAVQQQKLIQGMDTDGQFSQGVKSKMPSSLAVIPKSSGADSVEIIASDPCDLPVLKAISVGQQRDLLLLLKIRIHSLTARSSNTGRIMAVQRD